jgi:hypothetical protein
MYDPKIFVLQLHTFYGKIKLPHHGGAGKMNNTQGQEEFL